MWNDFFHQTQDNTVELYKFSRLLLTKQEIRLNKYKENMRKSQNENYEREKMC